LDSLLFSTEKCVHELEINKFETSMVDSRLDSGLGEGFVGACGVEYYGSGRKCGYLRPQVTRFGLGCDGTRINAKAIRLAIRVV